MLTANLEDRTVSGMVLPFNEVGRTNKGKVKARKGTLQLAPIVTLNTQHDGVHIGLKAELREEDDGWHGAFKVHEGPQGDALLAEVKANKRNMFSVEIPDVVIRAGEIVAGTISSVAAVAAGAFPSALMAADAGDLPADLPDWYMPSESTSSSSEEIVVDGVTYVRTTTSTNKTTVTPKGDPAPTEEEENMGNENDSTTEAMPGLAAALAQLGLTPAGNANKGPAKLNARDAFKAISSKHRETGSLEAALAQVTHDDGDNDGDGTGEVSAPQGWLGEVWKETPYVRRFAPLISQGILTNWREVGFRVVTKPRVADYAGNLAEVPTGGMTVEPADWHVDRLAHGADIDRRYVDFNDSEILEAFVAAQVQSYEEVIDEKVEAFIAAEANVEAAGEFIPEMPPGIVGVVDGALALIADRFRPTAAIMGADLYRRVLLTRKEDVSAYLTEAFGLEEGSELGFRIVPSSLPAYAGKVAVFDKSTLRVKELGGESPVRVQAEKPANGGQTLAVFGYYSLQNLKDGGARLVTPALAAPVVP